MSKLYADDKEWLRKHSFYVRKDGLLDERYNHCEPDYMAVDYCPNCGRNKYEPTKAGCCHMCRTEKEMNNA
jgi:hypothetical protein